MLPTGWQGNLIRKEPQATENQVTRFPTGKVVAPATKGGMHFLERSEVGLFPSGEARLYGLCRQRRHKKWRPIGRPPRQRSDTIYLPRARALNPSGRRQPVPDRTLGAQGQRPGGAINPRPRKRASTFGNTGSLRIAEGGIAPPRGANDSPLYFTNFLPSSVRPLPAAVHTKSPGSSFFLS